MNNVLIFKSCTVLQYYLQILVCLVDEFLVHSDIIEKRSFFFHSIASDSTVLRQLNIDARVGGLHLLGHRPLSSSPLNVTLLIIPQGGPGTYSQLRVAQGLTPSSW